MDDDIHKSLVDIMMMKTGMGNFYGLQDEFVANVLGGIDKGYEAIDIISKEKS
jgi:hypothetical protein